MSPKINKKMAVPR